MPSEVTLTYRGVRITVLAGLYLMDGRPTDQAAEYYLGVFDRLDELRQFAAEQLLDLYNDVWSDEDEPPLDQETFKTKLVHPAIVLDDVGSANVYFDDSDLFWGHGIEIRLEGTTPRQAGLVG